MPQVECTRRCEPRFTPCRSRVAPRKERSLVYACFAKGRTDPVRFGSVRLGSVSDFVFCLGMATTRAPPCVHLCGGAKGTRCFTAGSDHKDKDDSLSQRAALICVIGVSSCRGRSDLWLCHASVQHNRCATLYMTAGLSCGVARRVAM